MKQLLQIEKYVSAEEGWSYLGLKRSKFFQLKKDGAFNSYKFGKRVLFKLSELELWAQHQRAS